MALLSKLVLLVIFSMFLLNCSSLPKEEYVDYFYTSETEKGERAFTFILSVKGAKPEGDSASDLMFIPETNNKNSNRRRRSSSSVDNVPMSFKMEEEAFDRLEAILILRDYCNGDIEYTHKEYTWLRYTIKGFCKT